MNVAPPMHDLSDPKMKQWSVVFSQRDRMSTSARCGMWWGYPIRTTLNRFHIVLNKWSTWLANHKHFFVDSNKKDYQLSNRFKCYQSTCCLNESDFLTLLKQHMREGPSFLQTSVSSQTCTQSNSIYVSCCCHFIFLCIC